MVSSEQQYLISLQRFFDDENFDEMVSRTKFRLFEDWQRARKLDDRERIFAKLDSLEELCNHLRAAADTLGFEKQKGIIE